MNVACDPALFRLRAFESDWLDFWAASGSALAPLLLVEGEAWIALGQEIGHFAGEPSRAPSDDIEEAVRARLLRDAAVGPLDDTRTFAARLAEAQEDLTPARRAFLETVLFADGEEWSRRLRDVRRMLEELETPAGIPTPQALDAAAWLMEGISSQIDKDDEHSPAYWRSQTGVVLADLAPETEERLLTLAEVHAEALDVAAGLAARAHWHSVGEQLAAVTEASQPWEHMPGLVPGAEAWWTPMPLAHPTERLSDPEAQERHGVFRLGPLGAGIGLPLAGALRAILLTGRGRAEVAEIAVERGDRPHDSPSEEDLGDLQRSLRGVAWHMAAGLMETVVKIEASGPGPIVARDVQLPPGVEILNPDVRLGTLEEGATLAAHLRLVRGTPVRGVTVSVTTAQPESDDGYDTVTLEIETDGSIDPASALREAWARLAAQIEALRLGVAGS